MKYRLHIALFLAIFSVAATAGALGQVTTADSLLGTRTITYEAIDGFAVAEGDIIIDTVENIKHQGAIIRPKIGGYRWKNGVVPFELDEDLPLKNKLAIFEALNHWQQNSNVEFVELTTKNRYDYPDYLAFVHAKGTTCSSFVGRKGGRQIINLAPRCSKMNTVHEIGHALGLWHEQSRADRDLFVRIEWKNIAEEYKHNFEQQLTGGKDFGEYDYLSIMHYSRLAFSKNGKATIIPLNKEVEIGQRDHLSEKDIAAIREMYPEA